MSPERSGIGVGVVATVVSIELLEALCYPLISGGLEGAPPLTFAAMRAALAGVALALLAFVTRRPWPKGRRVWLLIGATGAGSTGLGFAGMFIGGSSVSPGLASVITNVQPFIAGVLAWKLLGEGLGPRRTTALAIGFLGIALVSFPTLQGTVDPVGLAWLVAAALGLAVGNVAQRAMSPEVDPIVGTASQLLAGACLLAIASALLERPSAIQWTASFGLSLVTLALLSTGLSAVLWFRLLARHPLNRLNPFSYLSAVFALGIGAVFFGERLAGVQWVGLVGVLAAGALASGDR